MTENRLDEVKAGGEFIVSGVKVNSEGLPLTAAGSAPAMDLSTAQQRIAELERQLGVSPGGEAVADAADTRNVADLKAALDAGKVEYPDTAKKADLQALAAQHNL